MKIKSQNKEVLSISFKATLQSAGTWVILRLPEAASEKLPSRGQVMVRGTIDGQKLEKVLEPDGRWGHWFKLDKTLLKTIDAHVGDIVTLEIMPSKHWPEPVMPSDFSEALIHASASVQGLWKKITPMARWEWLRWVNATSSTDTRERRIEVSISKLRSGKRRPCCFNLAACTDPDLAKNGRLIDFTLL